jgi:hypothetical protein
MADNDDPLATTLWLNFSQMRTISPQTMPVNFNPAVQQQEHQETVLQCLTKNCQHAMQQA